MLKIVSGKFGGLYIDAPEGRGTRPTTNRVRESVFSSLCSNYSEDLSLDGANVLDLFAGSGALGLEALSRGAAHCTFCEMNARAMSIVKKNAKAVRAEATTASFVKGDSTSASLRDVLKQHAPFDVVFLDPPYAFEPVSVLNIVENLIADGLISKGALLYYEHASGANVTCFDECFEKLYDKKFSEVGSSIYGVAG